MANAFLNDPQLGKVGHLKLILNSSQDSYKAVSSKRLKEFVNQDFSHPRHDLEERKDYTWLQSEFEKEDSFDPAQFNYVLLHANALIEFIEEQSKHRLPKAGKKEEAPSTQTFPYFNF